MNDWIPAYVKAQISKIEEDQSYKRKEAENKFFIENMLPPNYVLIDAALWEGDIDIILKSNSFSNKSLFRGSTGLELWSVAPYLVDIGSNEELVEAFKIINKENPIERRVTWLYSTENIENLQKHLRRFLRMKQDDGSYIYSRFYDPYVANTIFPNFTNEQAIEFFKGITFVETEDVRIGKSQVFYLSQEKELQIISQKTDKYVDDIR